MNKIVYNACYGGYGLSVAAMELIAELKGVKLYKKPYFRDHYLFYLDEACTVSFPDPDRHDPELVKAVETLGDAANGYCARLQIYETDSDQYRIEEYDGSESVVISYDDSWIRI